MYKKGTIVLSIRSTIKRTWFQLAEIPSIHKEVLILIIILELAYTLYSAGQHTYNESAMHESAKLWQKLNYQNDIGIVFMAFIY